MIEKDLISFKFKKKKETIDNRNNIHRIDGESQVIRRFIKKKRIECFQGFFSQFRYWKETRCNEACYRWKCDIRKTLDTFRNDWFECKWAMEAHNGTRAPCMPRPPCPEIHDTKVGFQFSYANSTPASIRMEFLFEMRFIRFTCTRNEDAQARIIFLLKIESRIPRLAKYSSMHPRYTRNTDRTIRIKNDSDESRFWTMPWKKKKCVLKKSFRKFRSSRLYFCVIGARRFEICLKKKLMKRNDQDV